MIQLIIIIALYARTEQNHSNMTLIAYLSFRHLPPLQQNLCFIFIRITQLMNKKQDISS